MKAKSKLIIQAGKLLDKHCKGCELIKALRRGDDRNRFCLSNCEVYKELREIGEELEGNNVTIARAWSNDEVFYLKHHRKRYTIKQLAVRLDRTEESVKWKHKSIK